MNKLPILIDLPENFLETEVRSGYTVTKEMKEIWAIELDLLNQVMQICEKYNIKYFLDSGSTIGVVRHKGFIPWDDDIDIVMLREDYDRFSDIAQKELQFPYFLQIQETDRLCMHGHIQVRNCLTTAILDSERALKIEYNQGVFIDIFPLDNICDNIEEGRKHATDILNLKGNAYKNILAAYHRPMFRRNLVKWILEWIQVKVKKKNHIRLAEKFYNEFLRGMRKYNDSKTDFVTCYSLSYSDKKRWKREWYDRQVYMDMEWIKVPICEGYLEYLAQQYGNWRDFVPNGSLHGGVFFDAHNPYTKYL